MKKTGFLLASLAASLMATSALAQDISVKIGVLNDRSGIYADLAGEGSVIAARMAVEDFGAAEKGIKVDIVSADHQNKPDVASTIARQWIDQDGVNAIVDVPTSSAALAVNELAKDSNFVFINSGAASSDLTGPACTAHTVHWTYDTWALANGTGGAMVQAGGDSWFFLTADYAFGHALERDTSAVVEAAGGTVVGTVRHPFPGTDFSSFLLQAQASGAQAIALLNAGADTLNSIKQANEFGIPQSGQQLVGLIFFETDALGVGIDVTQGLSVTVPFYWNQSDEARAVSERFYEQIGRMPSYVQIGVYSSVMHYLRALEHAGTTDRDAVADAIRELDVNDAFVVDGTVRADGRMLHTMLLGQVRTPAEMEGQHDWDIYNILAEIPAEESARPLPVGECAMLDG